MPKQGRGTVYQRGNKWACAWWVNGRQQFKGGFCRKSDAQGFLAQIMAKKAKGVPIPANANKLKAEDLFRLVVSDYEISGRKSIGEAKGRIRRHLLPYFEGVPLSRIIGATIEDYKRHRLSEGCTIGTLNRELSVLHRGYSLALQQDLVAYAPKIKQEPERNVRTQTFGEQEFSTFIKFLPDDVRACVLFQWETGWRMPSEVLTLTWAQVDFQDEVVLLERYTTKNGEPRIFPFTEVLRQLLKQQRQVVDEMQQERGCILPWVFPRHSTAATLFDSDPPKLPHYFRRAWKAALKAAKLTDRRPHDLRRSAAVRRDAAGVSIHDNMLLGGWKRLEMLERYLQKKKEDLKRAVKQIDAARTATEPLPFSASGSGK